MLTTTRRLLDVPPEVFNMIICTAVKSQGFIEAQRMRLVCKIFDRAVNHAILATRALEMVDDDERPDFLRFVSVQAIVRKYLEDQILTSRNPKNTIIKRFQEVLVGLYGNSVVADLGSHHIAQLRILIRAYTRQMSYSHRNALCYHESDYVANDSTEDIFRAKLLLGIATLDEELIALNPQSYPSTASNLIFSLSSIEIASIAGNVRLLKALLVLRQVPIPEWPEDYPQDIFEAIWSAAEEGRDEVLRLLWRKDVLGDRMSITDFWSRSGVDHTMKCLRDAAMYCSLDTIRYMAETCGMPLSNTCYLAAACLNRRMDIVPYLLSQVTDINAACDHGLYRLPLAAAAYSGDIRLVELLLNHGADVNHRVFFKERTTGRIQALDERQKPLLCASKRGHYRIVKLLLDRGATQGITAAEPIVVRPREPWVKVSPILAAARNGHVSVVELLDKSIPEEHAKIIREIIVRIAAQRGFDSLIRYVVGKHGIIGQSPTTPIWSPMMQAQIYGHDHIVKTLLELGYPAIDPLTTPMANAFRRGHFPLYVEHGAMPSVFAIRDPIIVESEARRFRDATDKEALKSQLELEEELLCYGKFGRQYVNEETGEKWQRHDLDPW